MGYLASLNKYFIKYKNKLFLGILFILISNAAQVYIPLLLREGIDSLQSNLDYDVIIRYALWIFAAAFISGVFRFLIRQTIIVVSREIEYDLRQDFWAHIQRLPLRFFQNNSTGNIMAHATNDISAVRMYVGPAVMYSIDTGTKFLIVIAIMFSLSVPLTIYTLLPLPVLSYLVYKLSKKIHKKFTLIQEKFSELTTMAQESFSGIRVIKSYVREASEIEGFTKHSSDYLDRNMDKIKIQALFMPLLYLITGTSIIIVILYGGGLVIEKILTLGDLTAFLWFLGLLIWPTIAFGWVANIIQQADASMKRLKKIWSEEYEIEDSKDTNYDINSIYGKIEFKNVSFQYRKDLPHVLSDINLTVNSGETLAIIGQTGEGKTSFVNLLSRLYDVTGGLIKIDGNDLRSIPLKTLRENIGLVTQETFLFSDTLKNNILYGRREGSEELLKEVSRIAKLDEDVENFPKGYETILGERGITLSGGQKQRTCLARALAIDPKILILDDSFSAVDTNTEEEILTNLKEFMKDRTSIIISHRISTVKNADKIIVLANAKIAEAGTHEELIALGGIYSDLHYKQLLEEELKEI
ncbi:MAG: ABC transporter ATP-binding protein/permease [Bacteroidetes bacterium]|nr:ABC transporter ATP-binding protein/permease [Bacteroidota bacterium]MBU1677260.1 ABC transporter ATP-binding protein/permease [Bacteroidota bacterium]MBU2507854.1 ABC transporter ATP-binding protein/permease [Bacteroidota bacterium]